MTLKRLVEDADSLYKEGRLAEAATAYRRILFVEPRYRLAARRLHAVLERLALPLVRKAESSWESDRELALGLLHDAFRLYPRSDEVKTTFKTRGYTWKMGAWRTEEEARATRCWTTSALSSAARSSV